MTQIIPPKQFCEDFARDVLAAEPLDRQTIAGGYATTLQSMLDAARREGCAEMGASFFKEAK